jgi:hypothetical protein
METFYEDYLTRNRTVDVDEFIEVSSASAN